MTIEGRHKTLLSAKELMDDPYGGFRRLREEEPLAKGLWNGNPTWFVTRHEDVVAVLTDRRFATNSQSLPGGVDVYAAVMAGMGIGEDLIPYIAGSLIFTDPPDHTRLRRLLLKAFSARRILKLRPRIEAIADELLDALPGLAVDGVVDLAEHFALPLSMTVIAEMVGVPSRDRATWQAWCHAYVSMDPKRLNSALPEVREYVLDLAEKRRSEPADDLFTGLILARDENGDRLSDTELITMVLTLLVAANENTTPAMISNGVVALLTYPDQLALLREKPELMPGAVQELLRYCGPTTISKLRFAVEDVVIGGTLIEQGDRVLVLPGSANHDPQCFARPERLDVTRSIGASGVQHLAYSRGAHHCVGASLANVEGEVAFAALLERYPDLSLAVPPERLKWKPIPAARHLDHLPVLLGTPSPPVRRENP